MPVLPVLRPREVVGAFERMGWLVARQRGSHTVLPRPGAPATLSIPDHAQVARGTLRVLTNLRGWLDDRGILRRLDSARIL